MKTAIYIEDGVTQLVLTAESKHEQDVFKAVGDKIDRVKVFNGSFYGCNGGWIRHSNWPGTDDRSLIMRLDSVPAELDPRGLDRE